MPDTLPTIAGQISDRLDLADIEVSDLRNKAPLVALLPAEESSDGTVHKYSKEVGAPVVGFRAENQGRAFSKDTDELVTVNLKILDWSSAIDQAVAKANRRGVDYAVSRLAFRHLKEALFQYERQIFYGGDAHADGFAGLIDADVLSLIYEDGMVIDGGASSGPLTSVFAVRLGIDDMAGVYKGDQLADIGETVSQNLVVDGKNLPVFWTPACTWLAIQIGSAYSVGRIANLGIGDGDTLDDDKIAELLSRFPAGSGPTHLVMNKRSQEQLRKSRTATNATGAPAPLPEESFNVPIITTDAIHNEEEMVEEGSVS